MARNSGIIELLKQIFSSAAEGVLICDSKGLIRISNPRIIEIFGYEEGELGGKPMEILLPEEIKSKHIGHRNSYIKEPHARPMGSDLSLFGKRKDNTVVPLEISLNPFEFEGEKLVVAFIIDISKRKQLEEELRNQTVNLEKLVGERTRELEHLNLGLQTQVHERKMAEGALIQSQEQLKSMLNQERELNVLKTRFVSMASHEFRTPLSTILSSISLVERYSESEHFEKRDKHVNRIKKSVKQLTDILDDFLSLGRLEEGKIEETIEKIEIREFTMGVVDELRHLLKPKQEFEVEIRNEFSFFTDRKMFGQILSNLITNGIKYCDSGIIQIKIIQERNKLILTVADEGMGIPIRDQKNIFTRFFRAGNVTNIEGTGLGLSIIKKYVDLMNGKISFKSKVGIGTTFSVKLPNAIQNK